MQTLTYKQAYDKIIDAYFKDEIKPNDTEFCFCGTLSGGYGWSFGHTSKEFYSIKEYGRMEKALFSKISDAIYEGLACVASKDTSRYFPIYTEDELFAGMSAALDVLKQIHIERGEIIDKAPVFTKRQLAIK